MRACLLARDKLINSQKWSVLFFFEVVPNLEGVSESGWMGTRERESEGGDRMEGGSEYIQELQRRSLRRQTQYW